MLLSACPDLRILATSREALQCPGEVVWRVPSLATPEASAPLPPEQISAYEAVQLFVARTTAAQPDFRLTQTNAAAVARICARLDGIPLAIEMAAAQAAAMNTQEIAARLDDCFGLLTSWTARGAAATAHPARDAGVELQPAHPAGTHAAGAPGGVRGWLYGGTGAGCVRR